MRVQELSNHKMRPGAKLDALTKLWSAARCLTIDDVSMVGPCLYNMLDCRAVSRRSSTHNVSESSYALPHHALVASPS